MRTRPQKTGSIVERIRALLSPAGKGREFRRAGAFAVTVVTVMVLCMGFFYVWTRMAMVRIGYEITTLEKKNQELKKRKSELLVELASLESPQELEAKAREKAGLIFPGIGKVIHVP
ncbi:MAG: septum formation initiator family protein [Thermodesulfobacteriota bacterium]